MAFVVFNQFPDFDTNVYPKISTFIATLKSLNQEVFFLDKNNDSHTIQGVKDHILTTKYGLIIGYMKEVEHRDALVRFVKQLKLHILLELPDYIYLDSNNFLVYGDTIFIGLNEKVNSDAGTFLFRRLVAKRKFFSKVIGIRCPDFDLVDVFRILSVDNKKYLFMNPDLILKDALLFNDKSASFFNVKKIKARSNFFEVKPEESTLKHLRFFVSDKNVLLFDDAFRLRKFFEENKFNLFLMDSNLRNSGVFPYNLIKEFH